MTGITSPQGQQCYLTGDTGGIAIEDHSPTNPQGFETQRDGEAAESYVGLLVRGDVKGHHGMAQPRVAHTRDIWREYGDGLYDSVTGADGLTSNREAQ
eukprot:9786867-Karenia_brevis.AAC.1